MRWRAVTWVLPLLGVVLVVPTWGRHLPLGVMLVLGLVLVGCVLSAVYHAEVVAHRVGEPFGSLVLAVAVTVIEVALIVTLMLTGGSDKAALARDTVFAAVMITCNGIVGGSLLVATRQGRRAAFSAEGTGAALGSIAVLATLSLALPTFTTSSPGPTFTSAQLAFAAVASLVVYALYVFVLTVRHREQFMPVGEAVVLDADPRSVGSSPGADESELLGEQHPDPPGAGTTAASVGLLLAALVGVVGLSKAVSPAIEDAVRAGGLPLSFVGVVIALLVLLPEGLAALRASSRGQVQTSMNLAYGSAMASIGLTIPAIAIASRWLDGPLLLGLGPTQLVFLALTLVVSILTVAPGRATLLQAGVHLTVFAGFLVLAASP